MAEKYGLGEPLFEPPEANVEYATDIIAHPGRLVLTTKVSSSSTGSVAIE